MNGRRIAGLAFLLAGQMAFALNTPVASAPGILESETGTDYVALRPTFSWLPVYGAQWYQIYCDSGGVAGAPLSKWVQATTSWQPPADLALKKEVAYQWWVRAWSSTGGYSEWSLVRKFTAVELKSVFIPAVSFCAKNSMTTWEFAENGGMIKPLGGGTFEFMAPVPLSSGAKLTRGTLRYRNFSYNNGIAYLSLSFYNDVNGSAVDLVTVSSNETSVGAQSASTRLHPGLPLDSPYHQLVRVLVTNANRWIIGVALEYYE